MSMELCPGIRDVCIHWKDAPMLQQTFEALDRTVSEGNDACIDCAKSIVEVVCRMLIEQLESPTNVCRPQSAAPAFSEWVTGAVRALKLGENQNNKFLKLVSQYHKLTTALSDLRNDSGPVSHGRDGFLSRLSEHHRRSALVSADAIVTFLHQAYLEAELDLVKTREPYENERLVTRHHLIDQNISLGSVVSDDGSLDIEVRLSSGEIIQLSVEPSRLLYQLDREAYVEALAAAKSASVAQNAE